MFYTFNQNNSGGSFTFREERGVTHYVCIEADNLAEALNRAEKAGIYFNGVDEGMDCQCCGDRWYEPYDEDETPSVYGKPAAEFFKEDFRGWMEKGKEMAVHYKDGRIVWLPSLSCVEV